MTANEIGAFGEKAAVHYLRLRGYTVKDRNWRAGHHEIDIVATRFGVIAFVEVKTRSYRPSDVESLPPPRSAVNADKQRFTRQAAKLYLHEHPSHKKPRMDVIEVWLDSEKMKKRPKILKITHLIGAY
jgi:putative endonuclease